MLKIEDTYQTEFSYTQKDVEAFARLTGDTNPMHLDADYMAKTPFKKPIMHGILSASIFSKVLGVSFPGQGTIYLKQSLTFKRPMYVDVTYRAEFRVKEIFPSKHIAIITTSVVDAQTGKITIQGEATVKHDENIG